MEVLRGDRDVKLEQGSDESGQELSQLLPSHRSELSTPECF